MGSKVGRKPGPGRPKGKKNKETLEKEAMLAVYRQKIMRSADVLYQSQMTLARGQTYLYRIDTRSKKPVLVTDKDEIEDFLQHKNGDAMFGEGKYYFLTTKDPDNGAIDSMLDRTFGRPTQVIAGDPDNPLETKTTIVLEKAVEALKKL